MTPWRALLREIVLLDPDAPSVEFHRHWYTWGEVSRAMADLARLLAAAALPESARIGVLQRNRPELVPVILEVLTSGNCLVTLNPLYPEERLAEDIVKVQVPVIVGSGSDWQRPQIVAAAQASGALGIEVTAGDAGFIVAKRLDAAPEKWQRAAAKDVSVEMLTSGTTGTPKRIPLRTAAFEQSILNYLTFEKGGAVGQLRSGVQILNAPFSHIGGLGRLLGTITAGRKSCLLEKFELEEFRDALRRHRPKVAWGAPAAVRMILDANVPAKELSSLTAFRCGSAPLDPDLADAFYERYGIPVLQNYGATEFGGVAGWTIDDFKQYHRSKRGSVGRLNKGVDGRVTDVESGEVLPPGTKGILELRAREIGDGVNWQKTTDLAIVDADRFLWIVGRADNMIIRGGFKVSPDDVARVLESHDAIRAAAVFGMPDARLGQVPVAALELNAGYAAPSSEELRSFLKERLLPYQVPVDFRAVAALPRNHVMKVDMQAAKALFQ